jgi:Uma2 family endonuclease
VGNIKGYWPGAPDLAIEVVSPGDSFAEVEGKVFDWLEAGARRIIVLNPSKHTATVYRSLTDITLLTENDTLDDGDVVPGWQIPVKEVFSEAW